MDDEGARPRKKPGCGACCGGSCLGALLLFSIVFSIAYSRTGIYRPRIPPPKPLPSPNAYDDYIEAGKIITASGGVGGLQSGGRSSQPAPIRQVAAVVQANSAALSLLRSAFPKESRVPPDRGLLPNSFRKTSSFRDIARLLAAEARVRAASGDLAGAFSSGLDSVELGTDAMRGGYLIHGLVGLAVQAIGQASMLEYLEAIPRDNIHGLKSRLAQIILAEPPVSEVMEEERAVALTQLVETDAEKFVKLGLISQHSWWEKNFGGIFWHFTRDQTIQEVEEYYERALPELAKPAARRNLPRDPKGPIAGLIVPIVAQSVSRFEIQSARTRIFLAALAIREYRLKSGELPGTLAALGLNTRAMQDPFTGKSLIYKRLESDFLLYAAGPDAVDDGGIPADEGDQPVKGDIGIRAFNGAGRSSGGNRLYRKVPYMKPPNLPAGAPPLNP